MAVTIDGDGTITGVSVGGLPDGIVDTDMIAADAVTAAKVGFKGFVSYAIICDQKADTVDGGTFTSGAWQTRDLNTEIADPDGIVSISSNQFTLGAGTYLIEASAPAHDTGRHQTRIYNASDSSVVQYGMGELVGTGDTVSSTSLVVGRVTITASKAFEIQHQCQSTKSSTGFGVGTDFGGVEIYTLVRIYKEA
jgi:hypothetical protein